MASIKGTGLLNVIKGLKIHREAALAALPERLHRYLDQQILVASWYPEEDFLDLAQVLCRHFVPPELGDPWRWLGQRSAAIDLVEIYSSLIQRGNPWATLQRLPRLWAIYHNSGKLDVGVAGDTQARVELRAFQYANDEYCRLLAGYLGEMLRLADAGDVEVRYQRLEEPKSLARWHVSWQ